MPTKKWCFIPMKTNVVIVYLIEELSNELTYTTLPVYYIQRGNCTIIIQ